MFSVLKMPFSLNQNHVIVGIFNNSTFVCVSRYNNFFSVKHSQDSYLIYCALHYSGKNFTLFLVFLLLLKLKYNARSGSEFFSALSFITIVLNVWIGTTGTWLYNILISLSGDVKLNPGLKEKSTSTLSIFHWNLNSITAHNYTKVLLLGALYRGL